MGGDIAIYFTFFLLAVCAAALILRYVAIFLGYFALCIGVGVVLLYQGMVFIFNKMYRLVVGIFKKTPQQRANQLKENKHQLYLHLKKTYEILKPILATLVIVNMALAVFLDWV